MNTVHIATEVPSPAMAHEAFGYDQLKMTGDEMMLTLMLEELKKQKACVGVQVQRLRMKVQKVVDNPRHRATWCLVLEVYEWYEFK